MMSAEIAWAERRCTTTTDPKTGATRESCYDSATGERTVTTTSAPETTIINVPVPPPSGTAPPPATGPATTAAPAGTAATPPGTAATPPPPTGDSGRAVSRPPRRDTTRDADAARRSATERAKKKLGYEDAADPDSPSKRGRESADPGAPAKGPDRAALRDQIRRLGGLINKKKSGVPTPPDASDEAEFDTMPGPLLDTATYPSADTQTYTVTDPDLDLAPAGPATSAKPATPATPPSASGPPPAGAAGVARTQTAKTIGELTDDGDR